MAKYYKDDEGTILTVDCGTDISSATKVELKIKKPDETSTSWTGSIYDTNYIRYTVVTDDFDQAGIYNLQAYVEMPTGKWRGETVDFRIYDNFES